MANIHADHGRKADRAFPEHIKALLHPPNITSVCISLDTNVTENNKLQTLRLSISKCQRELQKK